VKKWISVCPCDLRFPESMPWKSAAGHERRFRDVRGESALAPTPDILRHRNGRRSLMRSILKLPRLNPAREGGGGVPGASSYRHYRCGRSRRLNVSGVEGPHPCGHQHWIGDVRYASDSRRIAACREPSRRAKRRRSIDVAFFDRCVCWHGTTSTFPWLAHYHGSKCSYGPYRHHIFTAAANKKLKL
jgi:hypothetical protein